MGTPGTNAGAHGSLGDNDALHNPEVHHETSDISVRGVLWFVVILALTAAVVHLAMWGLFVVFDRIEAKNDPYVSPLAAPAGTLPPEPRLQTTPWEDLREFRLQENQYLASYGWVDEGAGVVHVPIERAKQLLLERGLPTRAGQGDPTEGTHAFALGESNSARGIPAGQADMSTPAGPAAGAGTAAPGGASAGGGQ